MGQDGKNNLLIGVEKNGGSLEKQSSGVWWYGKTKIGRDIKLQEFNKNI